MTGERKNGQKLTDGLKDRKGLEKLGAETAIAGATEQKLKRIDVPMRSYIS
jgi:hypothetical protein